MGEMVERVARAMWVTTLDPDSSEEGAADRERFWREEMAASQNDDPEKNHFLGTKDKFVQAARAAIEALHNPTDEMRNAYFEMARREGYSPEDAVMNDGTWDRMVDAALA